MHVLATAPEGWTGETGFITAEVFKRHLPPPYADHEYFSCGPDVMMDAIEAALGELKVPDRLVVATALIVMVMAAVFALVRVSS